MALNSTIEKDEYRLVNIRDIKQVTQGAKVMSIFDLKKGFYGIEIAEKDKYKTAFEFNSRVYGCYSIFPPSSE